MILKLFLFSFENKKVLNTSQENRIKSKIIVACQPKLFLSLVNLPKLFSFPNDTCNGNISSKEFWHQVTLTKLFTWNTTKLKKKKKKKKKKKEIGKMFLPGLTSLKKKKKKKKKKKGKEKPWQKYFQKSKLHERKKKKKRFQIITK